MDTARTCLMQVVEKNPELREILDCLDSDYAQIRRNIVEDKCLSTYSHQMKSVRGQLSVDEELVYVDGSRIVLPNKCISSVLTLLHSSHAGINKTYDIALVLSCSSSSAGSHTPRGQGSHVPPHGPYCLALYRAQAHCWYCPPWVSWADKILEPW